MSRPPLLLALVIPLFLASCSTHSSGPSAIGEAFAGPSTLSIRQDLGLRSPVVGTVKHGDRLEVLQNRRRFVQVRTAQGAIGWTDSRQLLSTGQMQDLRRFFDSTIRLPSQGTATAYETLNVHTEPNRGSPSFIQIPENAAVQVIGHKVTPRVQPEEPRAAATPRRQPKSARKSREKTDSRRIPPPPMPPAPKPPANWQELSRTAMTAEDKARAEAEEAAAAPPKPVVMEDWSLVRALDKDKRVGWVLTRMLMMSIPDDVAQYAEGHRITSYFALADIADEGQTKHAWLWTTMSQRGQPFEFDGFRVFTWNTKRHRYETVYRERDLKGFYPVEAVKSTGGKDVLATFSVLVDKDGQLIRKTYAFNGYRVNLVRKEPYTTSGSSVQVAQNGVPGAVNAAQAGQSWYERLRARVNSWFR